MLLIKKFAKQTLQSFDKAESSMEEIRRANFSANSVCHGCTRRTQRCHGECEEYKSEKKMRDAQNEDIYRKRVAARQADEVLFSDGGTVGRRVIDKRQSKRRWY